MNEIGVAIIDLLRQFVTAAGPAETTAPSTATSSEAATLSLGRRADAGSWEKGCRDLGFSSGVSLRKDRPTLAELKDLFKSTPTWLYLGGHFGSNNLYNRFDDVKIYFEADKVSIAINTAAIVDLNKGTPDFQLERNMDVMLWGGCDVFTFEATLKNIRHLFDNPLILGFRGTTGRLLVDAVLGGTTVRNHFFKRIGDNKADLVAVRNAWLETAIFEYGGGEYEDNFRALDRNGQEWKLRDKKIVAGRMIT